MLSLILFIVMSDLTSNHFLFGNERTVFLCLSLTFFPDGFSSLWLSGCFSANINTKCSAFLVFSTYLNLLVAYELLLFRTYSGGK